MREMKDSGISWVGEIPKEWNKRPIRSIIKSRVGGVWGDDINDDIQGVVCIRIADFDFSKRKIKDVSSDLLTYRLYNSIQIQKYSLQKNDILIEKSGGGEKTPVGRAVLFDKNYKALFANFMDRIRIDDSIVLPVFAEYWLWNLYSCRVTPYYINQTIGIQNIDLTFMLAKEKICFPSLAEQQRIADFLDRKCGKIDGLKADIQAQIDTLEQYKRSVITEAVTHGLNPSAPMKDSGIPWVGEIPAKWAVLPIYCVYGERKRKNVFGTEQNLLSLSYGKVIRKDINTNGGLLPSNYNGYNIIEKNDIIIRPTDLQNDRTSLRTGLVKEHGIITSAYIALKPKNRVSSKFYHYLLHSYDVKKVFYNMGNGVRQGLNYGEFAKLMVYYPPLDEHQEIADYLDNKCAEIEQIIADKKSQIETLDGYKKSLIYEYVTGKKEVV